MRRQFRGRSGDSRKAWKMFWYPGETSLGRACLINETSAAKTPSARFLKLNHSVGIGVPFERYLPFKCTLLLFNTFAEWQPGRLLAR